MNGTDDPCAALQAQLEQQLTTAGARQSTLIQLLKTASPQERGQISAEIAALIKQTADMRKALEECRRAHPIQSHPRRTKFNPHVDGFRFANTFTTQFFQGPIHMTFDGRCGGMVYASLDYFLSGLPIPPTDVLPPEGSVLSTYISNRHWQSILNNVDLWSERIFNPFGWRSSEFFHWGLPSQANGQMDRLKSCIDIGQSAPLGLLAPTANIGEHHQVLAIGYETGSLDDDLKIFVYDPNYPREECVMQPDSTRVRYIETTSRGIVEWLTYFVDLNYRLQRPNLNDPCEVINSIDWSTQNHSGRNYNEKDFRCSRLVATNFTGCTMTQADFSRSNAEGINCYGANVRNSNFSNAILRNSIFYGADLKITSLIGVDATKANFVGADLQTATLDNGIFNTADFYGANLSNTNCQGANFENGNFYGADLSNGKFTRAVFRNANFNGADLRNANLDQADFSGAIITGADFRGASRNGVIGLP
jgi:uncharacterized protein YjbI with pentapeptide repeats